MNGGPGTTPNMPEGGKTPIVVLCHARLTTGCLLVMWWLVCIGLITILLAPSPAAASVPAALALVGLLVWRLALLC